MNFKKWITVLKEWSKMNEHIIKVKEAEGIIAESLKNYKKPYIAYSGGKDSSVVLHLVLAQEPNIMVLHWDYGRYYIPRWLEKEIIQNAKKMGAKRIRIETSILYEKLKDKAINVLGSE